METMNIALPDTLKSFVKQRVKAGGYGTVSEYVRELIRSDQKELAKRELENEILRGIASGDARPMTKRDWENLRAGVGKRRGQRS